MRGRQRVPSLLGCSGSPFPTGGRGPQADPAGPGQAPRPQTSGFSLPASAHYKVPSLPPFAPHAPKTQTWGGRQTLLVKGSSLLSSRACQPGTAELLQASAHRGPCAHLPRPVGPPWGAACLPLPGASTPVPLTAWVVRADRGSLASATCSCSITPGPDGSASPSPSD